MAELVYYQHAGITLQNVIELSLAKGSIGLFYTPTQCQFGRWEESAQISDAHGKPFALEQVFEARLFHEQAELRWLREPNTDGLGRAVYLFDEANKAPDWQGWQRAEPLNELSINANQYLLWGEQWQASDQANEIDDFDQNNWSMLATARIGKWFVPVPGLKKNQRVRLKTQEYFGLPRDPDGKLTLAGQHGNQVVIEERWLSLKAID